MLLIIEPTIHLHRAKVGDVSAILEIEQECFREDSFSREQLAYLIYRSKGTFYMVVEQEQIIAHILLLFHTGARYLRIYSIVIHPDCRGRKLGQLLMGRAIKAALDCRTVRITLEVEESNMPAIRLCMKSGFIPVGVEPNYCHDGSNAIYM